MIKPRKTLENITPYKTDKYLSEWRLKLDSNENIYGCPISVFNALKNINPDEISLYPCYGKLTDKLSELYETEEDMLLLTNGADEALNIILNTYLDKNDGILSYNPSFSMPILYAKIIGAEIQLIEYDEKFVFDAEKIKNSIKQNTKVVYIATPNNPTGETVRANFIEYLANDFPNILFIVDCTYVNYAKNVEFLDYIDIAKKTDNILVVKSFSKDYAMAGLRLGFVIGNNEIIKNLKKVASPYNVNIYAMYAALCALNTNSELEKIKDLNDKARDVLYSNLKSMGFKPYESEGNFILCDFGNYCDFYYEKFKKNGVIVRNYPKDSVISTCLRITVPKLGGVKYILSLLNKKDILIFDLDGVIFDVRESYTNAIKETYKHFTSKEISDDDILNVKNMGGMNCDWDTTKYLLQNSGYDIPISDVINVFQDLFYNPEVKKDNYLIDKEQLIIPKEIFEELSVKYDMVVFSGRLRDEALYSLKKFDIDKYFYYMVTSDNLPKNMLKPNPKGVFDIIEHCPHLSVKYFGDSVDDIIAGNSANVDTIGVISPGADYNQMVNNFRHLSAKYIINDIKNIKEFLGDIEKDYAKSC